jgi:CheY-like chemotaxis protein
MSKTPTVLCVDDRADNLLIRKLMLEQFGCKVVAVNDARSCVSALNENHVDIVLIDYHLAEETNGEDLARQIRKDRPALPLIMLSGDPKIPDSARASVDAVLIKGSGSPRDLLDLIEDLVPDASLRARTGQSQPATGNPPEAS